MSGMDLSTKFSLQTSRGLFVFGLQHSHLLSSSSIPFPGFEEEDELGEYGFPRWRNVFPSPMLPQTPNLAL